MIKTFCDGCQEEIKGYLPGRYRVEIKELPPGQRVVTLHACGVSCLRDAVQNTTSAVTFARRQ